MRAGQVSSRVVELTLSHSRRAARLTYFAQLQVLSDEVADPDFKKNFKGFPAELALLAEEEEKLEAGIEKKLSSRRYLETLHADNARPGEETTCVVCSDTYTEGVLTTCGEFPVAPTLSLGGPAS